jgi:hypothetical protein
VHVGYSAAHMCVVWAGRRVCLERPRYGTYHNQWDLRGSVGRPTAALYGCGSQAVTFKHEGTLTLRLPMSYIYMTLEA